MLFIYLVMLSILETLDKKTIEMTKLFQLIYLVCIQKELMIKLLTTVVQELNQSLIKVSSLEKALLVN